MPLHTDDPAKPENVDDDTYYADLAAHAARVGDAGLHTVPDDVLADAMRRADEGQ